MRFRDPFSTPHLILGAAKSGKSLFAENIISKFTPPYIYLATAQVLDEEMRARVREHQKRRSIDWETMESPYGLVESLQGLLGRDTPVLVDCLTLWLSNLLLAEDSDLEQAVHGLSDFLQVVDYPLVLVSNEVGAGIVPDNRLARRFRDLAGWANQRIAGSCRTVTLVVAGLPLQLKSSEQ